MTDYNFSQHNTKRITKIGTGGGWVKASTGYSFARSGQYAQLMAANMRHNRPLNHGIGKKKYSIYDTLFLRVLHRQNAQGHALFTSMYQKNKAYAIFDFLSEATNFNEELKIISSFKGPPFIRAMFKK
jgi:lycopene beta-cyclase